MAFMNKKKKIVIFASNGFIGSSCVEYFSKKDEYEVYSVCRKRSKERGKEYYWDGKSFGDWVELIDNAHAIFNFSGRSVNCRHNKRNQKAMYDSRVLSTRIIGQAIEKSQSPPKLWLNASAASIYKESFNKAQTEKEGVCVSKNDRNNEFLAELAYLWEEEFHEFSLNQTRKILLRSSSVYGSKAPLYKIMRNLAYLGFGGKVYPFKQMLSWIHILDYCRACEHLIDNEQSEGVYNLGSPHPKKNEEFSKIFCDVLKRKIRFPLKSRYLLELTAFLLRTESCLVKNSSYIYPERLLAEGFEFLFPSLEKALSDIDKSFKTKESF